MKKKKITLIILAFVIIFVVTISIITVKNKNHTEQITTQSQTQTTSYVSLDEILNDIKNDYSKTEENISNKLDDVYDKTGDTYTGYVENKDAVTNWYTYTETETKKLFEKTNKKTYEYYKLLNSSIDKNDYDAIDLAMNNYYDTVYSSLSDEYYDKICDGLVGDVYDKYYDIIIDEDNVESYDEWSKVSDEFSSKWNKASTVINELWSKESEDVYNKWIAVSGEIYANDVDIDALYNKETTTATTTAKQTTTHQTTAQKTKTTTAKSEKSTGVDKNFKEAMDSYENFMNDYVDFIKKYQKSNGNDPQLISDYADYMKKYVDLSEKFEKWESEDLNTEETKYYIDVQARVTKKLLELDS